MKHNIPITKMDDIYTLGQVLAQSGIFGDGINPAVGSAIALTCYQENLTPVDFCRTYDIIKGRITRKAKVLLADFTRASGRYKIDTYTDSEVTITFSFRSQSLTVSMTVDQAIASGLSNKSNGELKDMWKRFPRRMLFARVTSEAIGILAPEISAGIYTSEEAADFDDKNILLPPETADPELDDASTPSITTAVPSDQDPAICSLQCPHKGQRWETLPDTILTAASEYDGTPPSAKDYIRAILAARTQTANH